MEASRNAVEAYRRTLLIDRVTTDDDNLSPVYRLDEILRLLRSSSVDMIVEMVEYTLKRLRNKSPRVKQKTLRLIKYTVGKAGREYKRQLQRHSAVIRALFTFKGQVDPLTGDALNKAVRDAAHEAIAAIFAVDDRPVEALKRMEGFGNSNFQMPTKGENYMMGFGSSSAVYTAASNEGIKRSIERQDTKDFEKMQVSFSISEPKETKHAKFSSCTENCSVLEDRLLDSITAPGGLRLQPTRESLQLFMVNAQKLDPVKLAHALKTKIQSHSWQVRLKAVCVLEAILRQQNLSFFQTVVASFEADGESLHGCVQHCLQSPQTSLIEKAKKVLDLILALDKKGSFEGASAPSMNDALKVAKDVPLNLMAFDSTDLNVGRVMDDILGLSPTAMLDANPIREFLNDDAVHTMEALSDNMTDDPFTGLHIHASNDSVGVLGEDLLSSEWIADKSHDMNVQIAGLENKESMEFTSMGAGEGVTTVQPTPLVSLESLACSSPAKDFLINCPSMTCGSEILSRVSKLSTTEASLPVQHMGNVTDQQKLYLNHPFVSPVGLVGCIYSNSMMPQLFPSETLQFNNMGSVLAQQQFLAALAGLQRLGLGVNMRTAGVNRGEAGSGQGHRDADSDGFDFSSNPAVENYPSSESIKEETHAFDFISDHLRATRKLKKAS